MKTYPIRWPYVLAAVYACAFIGSVVYMHMMATVTAFCGMYALIVTMPWSFIGLALLHITENAFSGGQDSRGTIATAIIYFSGILNTVLILRYPQINHWLVNRTKKADNTIE